MRRNYKRKKFHVSGICIFLVLIIFSVAFVLWAMKPDNFRNEKNKINSWLNGISFQDFYNAKSLILVDLSNDNIFISKRENEQQLPASLAKLFVIEYAATLADLDSIVPANYEAIQLTKPGSSVANIDAKKYFLHNLFAAMLVPSGNDAAYVVADYCGSILSPQAKNSQERINVFMEHLNNYLQNQGYENTILYDPSGYDVNALTTVSDLKSVSTHLLEKQWFRDIVSKSNYTATLPDGSTQTWRNTNTFLDQTSEYYNENVKGIKTGSLSNDYNLVVLYQQHGKEFLICSLGSQSDSSRYDDVNYIKRGWVNRNNILVNGEKRMFTITLKKASQNKLFNEIVIGDDFEKLMKMLRMNYSKAINFDETMTLMERIISFPDKQLAVFVDNSFQEILKYLSIDTELLMSSSIIKDNSLRGKDKIMHICKILGTNVYYNAIGGRNLYDKEEFKKQGIILNFVYPVVQPYPQLHVNDFVSNLSMIDILMNNTKDDVNRLLDVYRVGS